MNVTNYVCGVSRLPMVRNGGKKSGEGEGREAKNEK